ncbi:MAG: hypothetical protein U0835_25010 [Isosphaeraceae bacterium]
MRSDERFEQRRFDGSKSFRSTRIWPSGFDFSIIQAFIAPRSASPVMNSICSATIPKSRFRSLSALVIEGPRVGLQETGESGPTVGVQARRTSARSQTRGERGKHP